MINSHSFHSQLVNKSVLNVLTKCLLAKWFPTKSRKTKITKFSTLLFKFFLILIFVDHFLPLSAMHILTQNNLTKYNLPYFTIWHNKLERFTQANTSWGHIFSHVWPFYERAVSDQDP